MAIVIDGTGTISGVSATGITTAQTVGYAQLPVGSVLQVVYGSYGTSGTNTTTTYADSGLTATITPKFATSNILVQISQALYLYDITSSIAAGCGFQIVRNGTAVYTPSGKDNYSFNDYGNTVRLDMGATLSYQYLDSPASTSALTYKTQGCLINSGVGATLIFQGNNMNSTIVLMEIAA